MNSRSLVLNVLFLSGLLYGTSAVAAETANRDAAKASFIEALVGAYHSNSELRAKVYEQRSRHERVPQALAGFRPNVTVSAETGRRHVENQNITGPPALKATRSKLRSRFNHEPTSATAQVEQNIFSGGRDVAQLASAEHFVNAGYYDFRNQEQRTLLDAVRAYMDVVLGISSVAFNESNVTFLKSQVDLVRAEAAVGEKTLTDISEAESRLAQGEATLSDAKKNLERARATFKKVIGFEAGNIEIPDAADNLPASVEESVQLAQKNNPQVLQAKYSHRQAKKDVDATSAQLLPRVDVIADASRSLESSSPSDRANTASARVRLTVPLYQRGSVYSQTRERSQQASQARHNLDQAIKTAIEAAIAAWEERLAAQEKVKGFRAQVKFATTSRDKTVLEVEVGEKSFFEVLQKQSNLLEAQLNLAQAERDLVVAEYGILQAVGRLTAKDLGLNVNMYDIDGHYNEVRNQWLGFGDDLADWDMGEDKANVY
ncbi:MAG: TolC family outer membrane protein [Alphaproteobacteria bacterium]